MYQINKELFFEDCTQLLICFRQLEEQTIGENVTVETERTQEEQTTGTDRNTEGKIKVFHKINLCAIKHLTNPVWVELCAIKHLTNPVWVNMKRNNSVCVRRSSKPNEIVPLPNLEFHGHNVEKTEKVIANRLFHMLRNQKGEIHYFLEYIQCKAPNILQIPRQCKSCSEMKRETMDGRKQMFVQPTQCKHEICWECLLRKFIRWLYFERLLKGRAAVLKCCHCEKLKMKNNRYADLNERPNWEVDTYGFVKDILVLLVPCTWRTFLNNEELIYSPSSKWRKEICAIIADLFKQASINIFFDDLYRNYEHLICSGVISSRQ